MSLTRGIQSALFYYLSCAPCSEARYRKQRKLTAARDRADRDLLAQEIPDAYRHPEPSSTNPYWGEDIRLGPAGRGGKSGKRSKERVVVGSNVSLGGDVLQQRGDEELWGEQQLDLDGVGGEWVQRPRRARTRGRSNETGSTSASTTAYSEFRSPPISDLHPPVVRTVHAREEIVWMLQPPPVAEIMSGRAAPSVGRSGASSRQTVSRGSSHAASAAAGGDSPRTIPVDSQEESVRRVASRPPLLSTINSEGHVRTEGDYPPIDDRGAQRRQREIGSPPLRSKTLDDMRHNQHHVRATSDPKKSGGVLRGKILTTSSGSSPSSPNDFHTPNETFEDGELVLPVFDSWYTEEFELGEWVHKHTTRQGIRERWSMDL